MVDMNQTSTGPGIPPGAPPPPPPPHQDLDRLRRSGTDRYLSGVAGGIGRHFGIDPTVIRVLFVVLTFFGGAGVLVYGVCWLFVPEDGAAHAPIHVGNEPRKLLILAAVAIALVLAMSDAFHGFNVGWPIASMAVIVALVLIARDRREGRQHAGPPPYAPMAPMAPTAPSNPAAPTAPITETSTAPGTSAWPETTMTLPPTPPAPPAWQPPEPAAFPPRPRRTGVIWFWPTLALIAIALGTLGVIDAGHDINGAAYPALALAITGVMLVVGSFVGRPGGLIFVGLVSSVTLAFAAVAGGFNLGGSDLTTTPTTAAAVQSQYTAHNGRILLDLSEVTDPQALAGRTIDISLKAGEIEVIVPRSLNVDINAEFGFAGGIEIPGYNGGGVQDSVERHLAGTPATTSPSLDLDLHASVGHILVEQR
jgi:phage shock protein PspC (stress-responsive transcriptional regulator)